MTTLPADEVAPPKPRPRGGTALRRQVRRVLDGGTAVAAYGGAMATVLSLALLVTVLAVGAWPAIRTFGISFLWSANWDFQKQQFGALPVIEGTLMSSLIAIVIAVPLSVGTAIFLVRLAPRWLVAPASFLVELLAAIPSITYGMWGMFVLLPFLQKYVTPIFENTLGRANWIRWSEGYYLPGAWFQSGGVQLNLFAAGVVLAVMITPIITAITRDVLVSVPQDLEQGAYGLGATWWQATTVVLGHAKMGIFGAVILGLGRALGETMAVMMVIGNANQLLTGLFQPGASIASLLASQFGSTSSDLQRQSLMYAGLILLLVTMVINGSARVLVARISKARR